MLEEVVVPIDGDALSADLLVPSDRPVVLFAHGSGSRGTAPATGRSRPPCSERGWGPCCWTC